MAEVLIHDDTLVEGTECFTAEIRPELPAYISRVLNSPTTICIEDSHTVLYTFQQQEFSVFESNGPITVKLTSSVPVPSHVIVDVDVIDGHGNATGELICNIIIYT